MVEKQEKPIFLKLVELLSEKVQDKTQDQKVHDYFSDLTNKLFDARDIIISLLTIRAILEKELPNQWDNRKKERLSYELDNFYLRVYMFHQRMIQLINSVYLRLDPSNFGLSSEIKRNRKTTIAAKLLLNYEQQNSEALKTRRLLTHQSYTHYPSLPFFLVLGKDDVSRKLYEQRVYEEISKQKVKDTGSILNSSVDFLEKVAELLLYDLNTNLEEITRIY